MSLPPSMRRKAAPMISLCLVAGLWTERQMFHLPAGDAEAYHARVRAIADRLPYRIGEWVGTDVEPPAGAVSLLKPNLLQGREFKNAATGERATITLIQCQDARDMSGHWPPICYRAQGWTLRNSDQRDITVERITVPVTIYRFTIESIDRYSEILVYNFFVRPDGVLENGREGVRKAARDPRMKVFGAAQVQVVFDPSMTDARRDEVFRTLVTGAYPIIEAVLQGSTR